MSSTSPGCARNTGQRRAAVLEAFRTSPFAGRITIFEQGAGLHFLLRLDTRQSDAELDRGPGPWESSWAFSPLMPRSPRPEYAHTLVINYAGLTPQALPEAMERLSAVFSQWL